MEPWRRCRRHRHRGCALRAGRVHYGEPPERAAAGGLSGAAGAELHRPRQVLRGAVLRADHVRLRSSLPSEQPRKNYILDVVVLHHLAPRSSTLFALVRMYT